MQHEHDLMDKLVAFAKRRGFIFPTAEVYGGLQGFWDWGPLGVLLKNNIKKMWWRKFVQGRRDVVALDSAIITNPTVFKKSGHIEGFHDMLIECRSCHERMRPEDIASGENSGKCAKCGSMDFTNAKDFNTMFTTYVGPVADSSNIAYLRPETAQGIFVNFNRVRESMRMQLPFGIGQIGKAFRNEITPGNFIFRSREFEQMELEFFCNPGDDDEWFEYWVKESTQWFTSLGINPKKIHAKAQAKDELAHYAKATVDLEYEFPFDKGWLELMGISNRQDFDLKAHGQSVYDEQNKKELVPFCIEPSVGVERAALAFLIDAYTEVKGGRTTTTESTKEVEVMLKLNKHLSPIQVAVLPLSKKEPLAKEALALHQRLLQKGLVAMYDDSQSIGRRYRRQDEIGTPYCLTLDFDSLEDNKVTIRDRDTMLQERIAIEDCPDYLLERFNDVP